MALTESAKCQPNGLLRKKLVNDCVIGSPDGNDKIGLPIRPNKKRTPKATAPNTRISPVFTIYQLGRGFI